MDITDILIHVHPALSTEQREKIEEALSGNKGVISAHFNFAHPNELIRSVRPGGSPRRAVASNRARVGCGGYPGGVVVRPTGEPA